MPLIIAFAILPAPRKAITAIFTSIYIIRIICRAVFSCSGCFFGYNFISVQRFVKIKGLTGRLNGGVGLLIVRSGVL